jgi:hypothetical protein
MCSLEDMRRHSSQEAACRPWQTLGQTCQGLRKTPASSAARVQRARRPGRIAALSGAAPCGASRMAFGAHAPRRRKPFRGPVPIAVPNDCLMSSRANLYGHSGSMKGSEDPIVGSYPFGGWFDPNTAYHSSRPRAGYVDSALRTPPNSPRLSRQGRPISTRFCIVPSSGQSAGYSTRNPIGAE